jgi:hypothetical protein
MCDQDTKVMGFTIKDFCAFADKCNQSLILEIFVSEILLIFTLVLLLLYISGFKRTFTQNIIICADCHANFD